MKSIKPGRGPSGMGFIGSVAAVAFGIIWTATAASMGAPGLFPLFGVIFIILGIVQACYHFKNATGKDRFSAFDITDSGEESDTLAERLGFGQPVETAQTEQSPVATATDTAFCPYCGTPAGNGYAFCPKCGKKLP